MLWPITRIISYYGFNSMSPDYYPYIVMLVEVSQNNFICINIILIILTTTMGREIMNKDQFSTLQYLFNHYCDEIFLSLYNFKVIKYKIFLVLHSSA